MLTLIIRERGRKNILLKTGTNHFDVHIVSINTQGVLPSRDGPKFFGNDFNRVEIGSLTFLHPEENLDYRFFCIYTH